MGQKLQVCTASLLKGTEATQACVITLPYLSCEEGYTGSPKANVPGSSTGLLHSGGIQVCRSRNHSKRNANYQQSNLFVCFHLRFPKLFTDILLIRPQSPHPSGHLPTHAMQPQFKLHFDSWGSLQKNWSAHHDVPPNKIRDTLHPRL